MRYDDAVQDLIHESHQAALTFARRPGENSPSSLRTYLADEVDARWADDDAAWVLVRRLAPYALTYSREAALLPPNGIQQAAVRAYQLALGLYNEMRRAPV